MTQANIEVVGLGAGDIDQLPLGIYRKLTSTDKRIFMRTLDHPVVKALEQEGCRFHSLDYIYERHDQFGAVYEEIVEMLKNEADNAPIIYAVPGHPMLAERTVQLLLQQSTSVHIVGGQSYLDALFTALQIDPVEGLQFVDATALNREVLNYQQHTIFTQVYDAFVASEVKLTLLEDLPPEFMVTVVEAAGAENERIKTIPLASLDRMEEVSNVTTVYVPPAKEAMLQHTFPYLRHIIRVLRGPDGCPWDKKQTHASLRKYLLEETYELIDAIEKEDDNAIIEELGDVLLQVMLHSQIGEDAGFFTVDDVIETIVKKMIHRHPHVFGSGDATKTWDMLKREEKQESSSLLDEIIWHAPALDVAETIQRKAAKVGFDWEKTTELWEKFREEKQEFMEALEKETKREVELEFGDMLFVLANMARHYNIQPELALNQANKKFYHRFFSMEKLAKENSLTLQEMNFEALNELWERVKEQE